MRDPSQEFNRSIAMGPLDEMPEDDEQREYVRKHVEKHPCATALDEEQLEAAIDRILMQSHPDNIGRRNGRKPRHKLGFVMGRAGRDTQPGQTTTCSCE
jgi:Asp-tRNA(Asn)/Glu-tRNA(Gln) amidotransferase B subunit